MSPSISVTPDQVKGNDSESEMCRLQVVEHRQDDGEANPHDDREGYAHPHKVGEFVAAGAQDEQVRLVAEWCGIAHIGTE